MNAPDPLAGFLLTVQALAVPAVVGHRGTGRTPSHHPVAGEGATSPLFRKARENTRAAFEAAAAAGAGWIECDVLPSADGDLMLVHDQFLHGTPVWDIPTETLLAAGVEPLAGLAEALPAGLGLNLEIKTVPGDVDPTAGAALIGPVLGWVRVHGGDRPVLVSSFAPHVAAAVRAAGIPAGWVGPERYGLYETLTYAISAGLQAVVVHSPTALEAASGPELDLGFGLAARHGVAVWGWDMDAARAGVWVERGVTGLVVDEVPVAVAAHALHDQAVVPAA